MYRGIFSFDYYFDHGSSAPRYEDAVLGPGGFSTIGGLFKQIKFNHVRSDPKDTAICQ